MTSKDLAQTTTNLEAFEYVPLKTHSAFRLLKFEALGPKSLLRCLLEEHEIESSPPFVAVSYCWGYPSLTKAIEVNGRAAKVTPNLAGILQQMQADARADERHVWVDALCINQRDVLEKDVQIKLLPQIFSRAFKTVAQISRTDGDGLRVRHIKRFVEAGMELSDQAARAKAEYSSVSRALLALSQLEYWRRIWVVQEVSLAQEIEIVAWSERVGWTDFFLAVQRIIRDARDLHPALTSNMGDFIRASTRRLRELDSLRTRIRQRRRLPLLQAMLWTRDCEASRRQDKIFALLGLVTDAWAPAGRLFYGDGLARTEKAITLAHMGDVPAADAAAGRVCSLDVVTFTDPTPWRVGSGRWMPRWTYAPLWARMRRWQQLRLDWPLAQFAATPALSAMPRRSEADAIEVRGYSLGYTCRNRDTGWVYKEPQALLRAAQALMSELERYPRKAVLDWPVKGADENTENVVMLADLTIHRKQLQALIAYVQSVVDQSGVLGADDAGGKANPVEEDARQYQLYQSELRHFLLMGSSSVEASSTWTFDLMKFTRTMKGFIGFGIERSQPGDIVYMIHGCSTPVILRRFGSGISSRGYIVVGEMLVLGLTQGEFFREFNDSSFIDEETFKIEEETLELL